MAGTAAQGDSGWKGEDETRDVDHDLEERDAERLAREAAEEAEEEDAPEKPTAEEEGEW